MPKHHAGDQFMFQRAMQDMESETFSGPAYVSTILEAENAAGAPSLHHVVFDEGVINNWHIHGGGQILLATDGVGYHQIEGEPVQILHPGDVAFCTPGAKQCAHITINTNPELTGLEWFDRISPEEYGWLSAETSQP